MGNIVSNATPIIYLAKIGRLHLLERLYENVIIAYHEAKEAFTQLLAQNFRVSAEIYKTALNILERVRREKR